MVQKIQENNADVRSFLSEFKNEERYQDLLDIMAIMSDVSGEPAKLWGKQMIGFGSYNYKNKTTEGTWFLTGFSPRKKDISLYIIAGFENNPELLEKLGKHKTGKSCLYINRLSDIDVDVLKTLVSKSITTTKQKHS
ncbi:DUF1801 domain-containing protein [Winogradskyella jejuensis]|uniref:YdhG-like domain-containing protein n=1 Tax=Winogradskyella jejuensis TaxID=1089305 RepID=A0A1M5NJM7_9FLAO|nr:DUF1801 domain-containing protein [Winogradskyella jejuensis]SHG89657.1 protein of unknown function (DU1801) [Winogradskyella jejuensis]